jgi:hypothetical protein
MLGSLADLWRLLCSLSFPSLRVGRSTSSPSSPRFFAHVASINKYSGKSQKSCLLPAYLLYSRLVRLRDHTTHPGLLQATFKYSRTPPNRPDALVALRVPDLPHLITIEAWSLFARLQLSARPTFCGTGYIIACRKQPWPKPIRLIINRLPTGPASKPICRLRAIAASGPTRLLLQPVRLHHPADDHVVLGALSRLRTTQRRLRHPRVAHHSSPSADFKPSPQS